MKWPGKSLGTGSIVALIATLVAGCAARPVDDSVLLRARQAAGAGDWATTLAEAKRYTLDHPDDSAGHYMIGQAYLNGARPNLAHARGEMHMALELFHRNNAWGAFQKEGMPAEDYELAVHKDMARVHLKWIGEAVGQGVSPEIILERIAQCRQNVGRGRKLAPDDSQFRDLELSLNDLESLLTQTRRAPARPAPRGDVA